MSNSRQRSGSSDSSSRKRQLGDRARISERPKSTRVSGVRADARQPQKSARVTRSSGAKRAATERQVREGATTRRPRTDAEKFATNKAAERRRKQRARSLRQTAIIVGIVAAVSLIAWGTWAFISSPFFDVKRVEVIGANAVNGADVRAAIADHVDTTLFKVRASTLEEVVGGLPWIQTVSVKKRLPSKIQVTVSERKAAATVTAATGEVWVVSEDGRWLGALAPDGAPSVVDPKGKYPAVEYDAAALIGILDTPNPKPAAGSKVASPEVLNAVAVLEGLDAELGSIIAKVSAPEVGSTTLTTKDGVQLVIGSSEDMQVKSKVILSILKAHTGEVSLINVRSVDNPTWRGLDGK